METGRQRETESSAEGLDGVVQGLWAACQDGLAQSRPDAVQAPTPPRVLGS